jgi:hypothetical protein
MVADHGPTMEGPGPRPMEGPGPRPPEPPLQLFTKEPEGSACFRSPGLPALLRNVSGHSDILGLFWDFGTFLPGSLEWLRPVHTSA